MKCEDHASYHVLLQYYVRCNALMSFLDDTGVREAVLGSKFSKKN